MSLPSSYPFLCFHRGKKLHFYCCSTTSQHRLRCRASEGKNMIMTMPNSIKLLWLKYVFVFHPFLWYLLPLLLLHLSIVSLCPMGISGDSGGKVSSRPVSQVAFKEKLWSVHSNFLFIFFSFLSIISRSNTWDCGVGLVMSYTACGQSSS